MSDNMTQSQFLNAVLILDQLIKMTEYQFTTCINL